MREDILDFAASYSGADRDKCRLDNDAVICGNKRDPARRSCTPPAPRRTIASRSAAAPTSRRAPSPSTSRACGSPCTGSPARSASCTACMPRTSACRSIRMQCRGQLDGAVAMGLRLGADREHGARRARRTWSIRNCATTVFRPMPTCRTPTSSSPTRTTRSGRSAPSRKASAAINPVAPAVSNALADATGVRFAHLPFTPDRLFARLAETP